jgi:hypothetical protein
VTAVHLGIGFDEPPVWHYPRCLPPGQGGSVFLVCPWGSASPHPALKRMPRQPSQISLIFAPFRRDRMACPLFLLLLEHFQVV